MTRISDSGEPLGTAMREAFARARVWREIEEAEASGMPRLVKRALEQRRYLEDEERAASLQEAADSPCQ